MTAPPAPDDDTELDIPPFNRLPPEGTRERSEMALREVILKIEQLAALGLRPHHRVLEYKADLERQLAEGGPYWQRFNSGYF